MIIVDYQLIILLSSCIISHSLIRATSDELLVFNRKITAFFKYVRLACLPVLASMSDPTVISLRTVSHSHTATYLLNAHNPLASLSTTLVYIDIYVYKYI